MWLQLCTCTRVRVWLLLRNVDVADQGFTGAGVVRILIPIPLEIVFWSAPPKEIRHLRRLRPPCYMYKYLDSGPSWCFALTLLCDALLHRSFLAPLPPLVAHWFWPRLSVVPPQPFHCGGRTEWKDTCESDPVRYSKVESMADLTIDCLPLLRGRLSTTNGGGSKGVVL